MGRSHRARPASGRSGRRSQCPLVCAARLPRHPRCQWAQSTSTIAGFEACSTRYVLHADVDVMIGRRERAHDYLQDMVAVLQGDPLAVTVAFNIARKTRRPLHSGRRARPMAYREPHWHVGPGAPAWPASLTQRNDGLCTDAAVAPCSRLGRCGGPCGLVAGWGPAYVLRASPQCAQVR